MKNNAILRHKWLIAAITLLLALAIVSISYSAWDNLCVSALLKNGRSGNYHYQVPQYQIVKDVDGDKVADVGDVVMYGKYYQQANETAKTPISWIVVEKENDELTLLAEQILAYGSFWGNYYLDADGKGVRNSFHPDGFTYYQNYGESTLRKWLNYYPSNVALGNRTDGGDPFDYNHDRVVFRGFANEAFTSDEYNNIIEKEVSGLEGCRPVLGYNDIPEGKMAYNPVTDKIWTPSYSELFGTDKFSDHTVSVGNSHAKFSYFDDVKDISNNVFYSLKAESKLTGFAASQYSNYTDLSAISLHNHYNVVEGDTGVWRLRSVVPHNAYSVFQIGRGKLSYTPTDGSVLGIRPAIIIPV